MGVLSSFKEQKNPLTYRFVINNKIHVVQNSIDNILMMKLR